jgi:hypothetical protein
MVLIVYCKIAWILIHPQGLEEYSLLGCNIVYFGESPTIRKKILLPPSWSKRNPREKLIEHRQKAKLSFEPVTLTELHGVTCDKTALFIATAVRP